MKDFNDWKVAVIGSGTMGPCIAQHFAYKGLETKLYSRSEANLNKAYQTIVNNLQAMASVDIDVTNISVKRTMKNLITTTDLKEAVKNADIIFECVSEDAQIKKNVFSKIDQHAPNDAYICSDTSALNIYEIVEVTRPENILITHFFNPAHVMPLVEIVKGKDTTAETAGIIKNFLLAMGKKPIIVNDCIPGFIFNRLLTALEREAFYIVEQGVANYDDIDTVIKTTFGLRFGFEGLFDLLDHVGLDIEAAVVGDLISKLCNKVDAPELLLKKVADGEYGVKNGKGFKNYAENDIDEIRRVRTINIIKTIQHLDALGHPEH